MTTAPIDNKCHDQPTHCSEEQQQVQGQHGGKEQEDRLIYQAPPNHGLLLTLDTSRTDDSGLLLTFVPDMALETIHPHAHGPAGLGGNPSRRPSLADAHLLLGGGSGATVFSGTIPHYGLGSVVMKHGGPKETAEHIALATIEEELRVRADLLCSSGEAGGGDNTDTSGGKSTSIDPHDAAEFFRSRIPNFKFVYISPSHCRDRGAELWATLRNAFLMCKFARRADWWEPLEGKDNVSAGIFLAGKKTERLVRVFASGSDRGNDEPEDHGPRVVVSNGYVDFVLGPDAELISTPTDTTPAVIRFGQKTRGYNNLYALSQHLRQIQKSRMWKFTQGQSMIGGPSPRTASSLLCKGRLNVYDDRLLSLLTDEFILCIRNLQALTMPDERNAIDDVKTELALLEADFATTKGNASSDDGSESKALTAADVTKRTDMFVGFAIRKNFHPTEGRLARLRKAGDRFRACFEAACSDESAENGGDDEEKAGHEEEKRYALKEEEEMPAFFLGKLLQKGALLEDVFDSPDTDGDSLKIHTALDIVSGNCLWLDLIRRAVSVESDSARTCLWNCGLADAGLHNLFLDDERLWLFDLGEPAVQPVPAFLTKFLMSYFHAFGMEDVDEDKSSGDVEAETGKAAVPQWVRRFAVDENKHRLHLTTDTANVIPKVYDAFQYTVDRMIESLFDGEEAVRDLVVRYVVLQILSDCAFCVDRWTSKGGGSKSVGNHHTDLHKWLWRALWDLYIASDFAAKMLKGGSWAKCSNSKCSGEKRQSE
mmetsp:Transcript_2909/g.6232  ORF Transcript_2909/g.6232 Transcript_2909/m.6232 type:complete len:767 (+) Transcript_2909:136-2436(+)